MSRSGCPTILTTLRCSWSTLPSRPVRRHQEYARAPHERSGIRTSVLSFARRGGCVERSRFHPGYVFHDHDRSEKKEAGDGEGQVRDGVPQAAGRFLEVGGRHGLGRRPGDSLAVISSAQPDILLSKKEL